MSNVDSSSASRSGWPSPALLEQTGEGLLVLEPCWLLRWTLTGQQQSELQAILGSQVLMQTLDHAVPETLRPVLIQAIQSSLHEHSRSSAQEPSAAVWQHVIVAIARACDPELDLDRVSFKPKRRLAGGGVALRSSRHQLAGMVLRWGFGLLWAVVQVSANQAKPATLSRLRQQCVRWSQLINQLNADQLLSAMLVQAARQRIPVYPLDGMTGIWQLGMGCNSRLVWHSMSDFDSYFGVNVARHKRAAREWMAKLGCSVPAEVVVVGDRLPEQIREEFAASIGFPCVVKPESADRGMGVTADIQSVAELQSAIAKAHAVSKGAVLLQAHVPGDDHRLYVIDGQLTHVIRREPPRLFGNGKETVDQLLLAENERRQHLARNDGITQQLNRDDPELQKRLQAAGFTWDAVLPEGECLQLRSTATVHAGGVRTMLTVDAVHPVLRRQCEAIARTFRLRICGLDFISTDLSADPRGGFGAFIEVNSAPETPFDRAEALLDNLFGDQNTLIPVDVWIADWPRLPSAPVLKRLRQLLQDQASAVLAIPHSQLSGVAACLPLEASQRLQGFDHVHEPALNRAATNLVYLLTPEHVLQHGMPHSAVRTVHTLELDRSVMSHQKVLELVHEMAS